MISMSGATSATRSASSTEITTTRRPSSSMYVNGSMIASGTSWRSVAERTVSAWIRTASMPSRSRAAALGPAQHHVVGAVAREAVRGRGAGRLAALAAPGDERLGRAVLVLGRLAGLQALQHLVGDDLR